MASYKLSGGCACGNFRYEFNGELAMAVHCHCRDCQKSSGTGSAAVFATNRTSYTFTGEASSYKFTGDSGKIVERFFCPNCGSPLFSYAEVLPDLIFARIASLDEPSQIKPSMHIYCDSSQAWDRPNDHLAKFGKMPT
jgi:hypothetical protein